MPYLLDTAALYANAATPEVLPPRIRKLLGTPQRKWVCGVSLLELAIHYRRGRLGIESSLKEFFDAALAKDIEIADITPEIAIGTNDLPSNFPGDPFDRTIAATARAHNFTLITPDRAIRDSGVCEVEFYPFRPQT